MSTARRFVFCALVALLCASAPGYGQVSISLDRFGVGSVYRPNSWVGIRLTLQSDLDEVVTVRVQWEVENADGDLALHHRTVSLNPGQPKNTWLYTKLLASVNNQTTWTVRALEERDGRIRGELGVTRINPASAVNGTVQVDLESGLIGVIGSARPGISGYMANRGAAAPTVPWGANELSLEISGLAPDEMPDRREGLKQFEAIVWTNARPEELQAEAARALKDYVAWGGHLVIVLPNSGDSWSLGVPIESHFLSDVLPTTAPMYVDAVPVRELVPILSKSDALRNPDDTMPVHFFDPAALAVRTEDGSPGGDDDGTRFFEPLVALPAASTERDEATGRLPLSTDEGEFDGRIVVIQRTYGFGRITISGIDVAWPWLQERQAGRLPHTDAFWNRILGRRADTPLAKEIRDLKEVKPPRIYTGAMHEHQLGSGSLIRNRIGMTRSAAQGVLAALALFLVYGLVAGPGSFFFLKHHKRVRHSWVAFVLSGGVFTALAWGAVEVLRNTDFDVQHVTFLDKVHRPSTRDAEPSTRAISWLTAYLPRYGRMRLSIEDQENGESRNLLSTWAAPPSPRPESYPNVDSYEIPLDSSADYAYPARATATELKLEWMGDIDPEWGRLPYELPDRPIKVRIDRRNDDILLSGVLKHDLPVALRDVRIIHITPFRPRLRRYQRAGDVPAIVQVPGQLLNYGRFVSRPLWEPGEPLDLSAELYPKGAVDGSTSAGDYPLGKNLQEPYYRAVLDDLVQSTIGGFTVKDMHRRRYMDMLSFYHQLHPPDYVSAGGNVVGDDWLLVRRHLGRELDLSPWFSRPCLIIIGHLEPSDSPIPIRIGEPGRESAPAHSEGMTIVRWIHPLPLGDSEDDPEEYDLLIPAPRTE